MNVLLAIAGLLLSFGKGGAAGAFGPLVTVVLVLSMPANDALGVALPMLIFADVFSVAAYWREWEVRLLPPLVLASLGGVVLGTLLISSVSDEWLRRVIGIALLVSWPCSSPRAESGSRRSIIARGESAPGRPRGSRRRSHTRADRPSPTT